MVLTVEGDDCMASASVATDGSDALETEVFIDSGQDEEDDSDRMIFKKDTITKPVNEQLNRQRTELR